MSRLMRILMTSTSYPRDAADWRGIFIRELVAALARADDIELQLWAPPGELPPGVEPIMLPAEAAWLGCLMDAGGISHMMRNWQPSTLFAPLTTGGGCSARRIAARAQRTSTTSTGCNAPCHFPQDRVPALISVLGNDLKLLRLPLMRSLLRRAMRRRAIAICPNADWMRAPLEAAFGDLAEIITIPLGIDPRWFAIERAASSDKPLWLAVTRLTVDKLGPLFEWSEPLFRDSARELHLFGPMQDDIQLPAWIHYHGPATPEQLASDWFPRVHGLITLSRHAEGRPQVMIEAMAAGLPIVASQTSAHAAIVCAGQTGLLCDAPKTYADALRTLEDPVANRRFSAAARQQAKLQISTWDECASRYKNVYRQLIESEKSDG